MLLASMLFASMIDSSACAVRAGNWLSEWLSTKGLLSHWLTEPLLVMPVFVILFQLLSFIPRRLGRRPLRLLVCASALVYLTVLFPPTIRLAETVLVKQIPQDSGKVADAVVVLGRGESLSPSRVEVAAKLWEEKRAPIIFTSGIWDAPRMVQQLHSRGIPDQDLSGEGCSRTTYENAKFTADVLKPQGIKRILLVTDAPHMLRSQLTFQNFGFTVIPVASSGSPNLSQGARAKMVMYEYAGLVSYGLMGRFSAKEALKLSFLPVIENVEKAITQ